MKEKDLVFLKFALGRNPEHEKYLGPWREAGQDELSSKVPLEDIAIINGKAHVPARKYEQKPNISKDQINKTAP